MDPLPAVDPSRQPLAFVTMVRGDHRMLARWIDHHARLAGGRHALHVVAHGPDPGIAALAQGCSLIVLPWDPSGQAFEPRRVRVFFGLVEALRGYYRHVVTLDADEFLVPDPSLPPDLGAYLDSVAFEGVALSPLGFDVIHRPSTEPAPLDWSRPFTQQRRHGCMHVAYSKPCIFRARPARGGNQHRLTDQPWQIDPHLLLLHMRFVDRDHSAGVGRLRMDTLAQFDAAGPSHRIGTWSDREAGLANAIARVETGDCPDLTAADRAAFAMRQSRLYEERGRRLVWKRGVSRGFRLPDEWIGTV